MVSRPISLICSNNTLIHLYKVSLFYGTYQISFSGYFIYDFFDMASNHRTRSTCELLIHHSLVTMCLGVSLVTRYYHGYAQIALLVEINSIFLHIRQLLIIQGWNKDNASYKINSYLNLSKLCFLSPHSNWICQVFVFSRYIYCFPTTEPGLVDTLACCPPERSFFRSCHHCLHWLVPLLFSVSFSRSDLFK